MQCESRAGDGCSDIATLLVVRLPIPGCSDDDGRVAHYCVHHARRYESAAFHEGCAVMTLAERAQ